MTAHDLGNLLEKAGGKTCIINRLLETGNRICCAIVGFEYDDDLESAFYTELILGSVKLFWARMDLLTRLYEKKSVLISRPTVFDDKSWAQVVLPVGSSDSFYFASGSGFSFSSNSDLNDGLPPVSVDNSSLNAHLGSLEQSLELLANQVSATLVAAEGNSALDMVVDGSEVVLSPPFSIFSSISALS
ncbi:hypothetical protein G9A89_010801 [Geosiphon pyriformis]|nr:hypothetical protein G9A89_010801 [Geosiphon pyriformis]